MALCVVGSRDLEQCCGSECAPAWSFAPALPSPGGKSRERDRETERERERQLERERESQQWRIRIGKTWDLGGGMDWTCAGLEAQIQHSSLGGVSKKNKEKEREREGGNQPSLHSLNERKKERKKKRM